MITLDTIDVVLLAALGFVLALDQDAGVELQLGQPLIAAMLAGCIVQAPLAALAAGVLLQLVWITLQPVGGARLPDVAAGSVTAAALVPTQVQITQPLWFTDAGLGAAVGCGIVVAYAGGALLRAQRWMNGRTCAVVPQLVADQAVGALERLHVRNTLLHGVRGALVVTTAVLGGRWCVGQIGAVASVPIGWWVVGLGSAGLLHASRGAARPWLVLGLLLGLVKWRLL